MEITPSILSLTALGQTFQLTARVYDANNQVINDATVTWSSSATTVATVSNQGLVAAVKPGKARITARSGNASGAIDVSVSQTAASISVEPTSVTFTAIADTIQLSASVLDAENAPVPDASVTWSSNDAGIATVDSQGLVTAVRNGSTQITAQSEAISRDVAVTVSQVASRITIEPSDTTLTAIGDKVQLHATAYDANDYVIPDAEFSWSSRSPASVSVDSMGVATALQNSGAWIEASSGEATAEVFITVMTISPDREVLSALYENLDGANWISSSNWLSDKPLNEWYNVTTDGSGRVTVLWLVANNLSGTIPAEIAGLSRLEALNLDENALSGPIPPDLGRLPNLELMVLSNNQLTGNIPVEIAQLSNLNTLELSENALTGSIPPELGQLSNLWELLLSGNQLTGAIPSELGQLSNLSTLILSQNRLTGSLPPELGQLHKIVHLSLADNPSLTGPLPRTFLSLSPGLLDLQNTALCIPSDAEFQEWLLGISAAMPVATCESEVTDRDILVAMYSKLDGENWTERQNWLTDAPIGEWYGIETDSEGRIRAVSLKDNRLSGAIPSELVQLANLESLDLSSNSLTGPLPVSLGGLDNLSRLQLQHNVGLTGILPESWTELQNLEQLLLHGTQLCAQSDFWIQEWLEGIAEKRVTNCADLASERIALDALYNRTLGQSSWTMNEGWESNERVGSWYGVTANEDGFVTGLNLTGNGLRGRIPEEMYLLNHLARLELSDNPFLGGPLPIELTRLNLDTLALAGTQLCFSEEDEFQEWLSTIDNASYETCDVINPHPDLEALTAFFNATNGPEWVNKNNWLSHSPLETWHGIVVGDEGRVTEINLFSNDLEGELPPEIGELTELKRLYLESNRVTGSLPSEIGKLHNLETLILMYNDLTGSIPPEIGQLGSLETLLLFDNALTGTIPPEIGQLSNLEILRLDDNVLEGNVPNEIGQLTNLKYLFLGSNRLTGQIPEEIGQLANLTLLDLSEGRMTGSIPGELWQLSKLEYLRLAVNRLSGPVSSDIALLTNLEEFDIRFNMEMSGRLPHQMTSLNLTLLLTRGTSVCTPTDAEFQAWLQGISLKELADPCPF